MKIDREQIEKMAQAMCGFCAVDKLCVLKCCAPCSEVASQDCTCKESAEELICKCYGDVSEYKAEIEQLNKKLAKQTRIARDANAKCNGTERYLRPFQYKANRLETKCSDLKKLSDWQREEIKRLKDDYANLQEQFAQYQMASDKEIRAQVKQAKIDMLNEAKKCSCCDNFFPDGQWHRFVFVSDIDILIKRVENDK